MTMTETPQVAHQMKEHLSDSISKDISTPDAQIVKERPSNDQKDELSTQAAPQTEARPQASVQLEARPHAADQHKVYPRAATQQEARSQAAERQRTERPHDSNLNCHPVHKHKCKTRRGCRGGKNKRVPRTTNTARKTWAAKHNMERPTESELREVYLNAEKLRAVLSIQHQERTTFNITKQDMPMKWWSYLRGITVNTAHLLNNMNAAEQ